MYIHISYFIPNSLYFLVPYPYPYSYIQYIHISYFIPNSLDFLVPYPYIFLLPFLSPSVTTSFFSLFVGLFLLFCYIH